jgi:NADPH-dependent 2,4-dienoyl-CoA reductase/sulfur reductase-like enzyme
MTQDQLANKIKPVIVGAGPAGVRAAHTLVRRGLRPTVIDEAPLWGGQIYRQPPTHFQRSKKDLYGFESKRAHAVHQAMADILRDIDYQPETLVWNAQDQALDTLRDGITSTTRYTQLIVATGATDRILPFPGWTLPGVYSLGAAQVALKAQGCAIGQQVVFAGTGPLLYLVAYQYARAGAKVLAVLDTAAFGDQVAATGRMLTRPSLLVEGMYYVAWLRSHGVKLHHNVQPLRAQGSERVSGIEWSDDNGLHSLECDAIGFGYALRSETQLADILGCKFLFDDTQRAYLPVRDAEGRSSVPGIYLAGDGAGIMGADAAEAAGELAALALIADTHPASLQKSDRHRMHALQSELTRTHTFRQGLERAFPFPEKWASQAPDDLIICRCEEITAGELRQAVALNGALEINRVKALTRVGMGRCQSRMCAVAAAEIIADCAGIDIREVGRLRGQAPIKPIPFVTEQHADTASQGGAQ